MYTHTHINLTSSPVVHFSFSHQPSSEWPRATSATHGNLQTHNPLMSEWNHLHTLVTLISVVFFPSLHARTSIHPSAHHLCTCVCQYLCEGFFQTVASCHERRRLFDDIRHNNHCWLAVFAPSASGPAGEFRTYYWILSLLSSCWLDESLCSVGAQWLQ